jgi:hypothetical protein
MNFSIILNRLAVLACAGFIVGSWPARAEEQPFAFLYATDTEARGEAELEQWVIWKSGHSHENFSSFESRSEFEYGITSDLQGSLYLNYDWSRSRAHILGAPTDRDSFVSVSGELIYRVLDAEDDPIGLAFYVEPTWGAEEREFETKILLQKNFLDNRLRFAFNLNLEDSWDRDHGHWSKGGALELDLGLAYSLTPEWGIAAEFNNEREFDGLILGGSSHAQSSAYYFGPTIQYAADPITVTLGAQAQLPCADNLSNTPGAVEHGFASGAERYRLLLRLSAEI